MTEQQLSLDDLAGTIPLPVVGERILFAPYINYPDVWAMAKVVKINHGTQWRPGETESSPCTWFAVEYTSPDHPEWGKDTGWCDADEYPLTWRRMT